MPNEAVSQHGLAVAIGGSSSGGGLAVWELGGGTALPVLAAVAALPESIAWVGWAGLADGQEVLLAASAGKTVTAWRLEAGRGDFDGPSAAQRGLRLVGVFLAAGDVVSAASPLFLQLVFQQVRRGDVSRITAPVCPRCFQRAGRSGVRMGSGGR